MIRLNAKGVLVRFNLKLRLCAFVAVLVTTFVVAKAFAAVSDIRFSELGLEDGLSHTTILTTVEDHQGYIWVGTINGLNRYSGYGFKQYHPDETKSNALPSGFIRKLYVTKSGQLWVGTLEGLARYRPETDDFQVFTTENSNLQSNDIWEISEKLTGELLVADKSSVYQFDKTTQTLSPLNNSVDFPEDIRVIRDETNRTWIGSHGFGAYMYDKKRKQLFALNAVNPWGINLLANTVFDIQVIDGEYWLATELGVMVLNANGETVRVIDKAHYPQLPSNTIRTIRKIGNEIWLGTELGLGIVNTDDNSILAVSEKQQEVTGLGNLFVFTALTDRNNVTWLGTYEGLYKYYPSQAKIPVYRHSPEYSPQGQDARVWSIDEDKDGNVWVATQSSGLGRFNPNTGNYDYFLSDFEADIWDFSIDDDGNFWIATSVGLFRFTFSEGRLVQQELLFADNLIDNLYIQNSSVWTYIREKGLYVINTSPSSETKIVKLPFASEAHLGSYVPIYIDEEERLWLTTPTDGVEIYDVSTNRLVAEIPLSEKLSSNVSAVYNWDGYYWLTTVYDGIVKVDKVSLQPIIKQSTRSSTGIIFASVGFKNSIWYTDNSGLHEVLLPNLQNGKNYTLEQLDYNSFSESAAYKTSENALIFGGNKGFQYFKPSKKELEISKEGPSHVPMLFDIMVFGNKVKPEPDSKILTKPIYLLDKIVLNYDDKRFNIDFGIINPLNEANISYRYKLTGWDKEWTLSQSDHSAYYNDVSFGNYTLEVQAKEEGKDWSPSRKLAISITPPPWLYTSALALYAFFITMILVYLLRQYQARKVSQAAIRESEERLKLTLWSSGDELWDWDVFKGQVFRSNTWGTLDFPQDDIRATSAYDANIHPNDITRVKDALQAHLDGKSEYFEQAYRARTFKNKWIWLLDRGKVVKRDHNQQPVRMTGTLKNIHHLKEAEEQLNLFKRSIENISEGVFITNTNFRFISVNNAYCRYTGETREQALASYIYFHQYPEAFTEEIKKSLRTKGNWSGEVESVRVNGERYEMELNIDAVHDEDGKINHFVGVFSDITSRKNTEKELLKLANTDPLTELPNRSFFQASHQNLVRRGTPHALLCLDMDNFKKINDSLGHQTGDVLIKQIAKRLQRLSETTATCYRLGGDEFSILFENQTDVHTITRFTQSILTTLARPFIINKQEFVLSASVGIAFYPEDGASPQELLKNADTAMYFAKNSGGNSYQFFSGEMNQNAVRQLQIENLIRQGIKDDLFTVYYQPKVDITSGKLVSMEALVRFEHPQKGIVSPGQFIPLAEQTGQIIEIGEQVLRKSCEQTKRWVDAGLFTGRVAVNISAKQFELPDLDDRIERILRTVGLSPLHLECEITEGTLMENPEQGLRMMERLREKGIHLALDDFGTGYSSLAYLKRFPLNTLKIDKAFIDDIAESNVDRHMAAAIINIAHNLGLKVVAEGVEYEKQLAILRRYDCEMIQGFLYSKPLNAERFERLLTENHQLHSIISPSSL